MEFKTIYSMNMAGYLMMEGFVLMDIGENNKYPGRKVFFFKQSDNLERAMGEYLELRNKTGGKTNDRHKRKLQTISSNSG